MLVKVDPLDTLIGKSIGGCGLSHKCTFCVETLLYKLQPISFRDLTLEMIKSP